MAFETDPAQHIQKTKLFDIFNYHINLCQLYYYNKHDKNRKEYLLQRK